MPKLDKSQIIKKCKKKHDPFFNKPDFITECEYILDNKKLGQIGYRHHTGQITDIFVEPKYRRNGLGKVMLSDAITDMETHGISKIFAITVKDHGFWSGVVINGSKLTWSQHPDPNPNGCTGRGYYCNIGKGAKN